MLRDMARGELGKKQDDKDSTLDDSPVLHYPLDFMISTWQDYRQHGHLPMPGGLIDQDEQWWLSYLWINKRYNIILRGMMDDNDDGDLFDNAGNSEFTDWIDLTKD